MLAHEVDIISQPPLCLPDPGIPAAAPALSPRFQDGRVRNGIIGSTRLPASTEIGPKPEDQCQEDRRESRIKRVTTVSVQRLSAKMDLVLREIEEAIWPTHDCRILAGLANEGGRWGRWGRERFRFNSTKLSSTGERRIWSEDSGSASRGVRTGDKVTAKGQKVALAKVHRPANFHAIAPSSCLLRNYSVPIP